MNLRKLEIDNLEHALHEFFHLGDGGIYVNMEDLIRLNKKIRLGIEAIYPVEAVNCEEEALLCTLLLQAYGCLMCQDNEDAKRRQSILDRSSGLLKNLSASLLKCRLLVSCYAETHESELSSEAHAIMSDWLDRALSVEEQDVVDMLRLLEDSER